MTNERWLGAALVLLAGTSTLAVACGDDDDDHHASPDGGAATPEASGPSIEAGTTDGGSDAATTFAPITPKTTARIANSINPYGLVFGSDGNVYASGSTNDAGTQKLAVWRFKDGALDTTFGTGGVLTLDIAGDENSFDIVEVSAGNFVVHASAGGKVYLVKLTNTGGTYAFGEPVFVKFGYDEGEGWPVGTPSAPAAPPSYTSWGIGLDKSDAASPKIVVFAHGAPAKATDAANQRIDNDRWVTRVLADTLAFDTSFNGNAPYTVDADGKGLGDNARRGLVLADGSIVSSGYTDFGENLLNHVVLIRLLPTGAIDTGFGFGTTAPGIPGQTKFNPFVGVKGFAEAYNVVRQSNGFYVTTGYGTSNTPNPSKGLDLVSFRVKPDGIDTAFGELGSVTWQSETDKSSGVGSAPFTERGRDLAVLADDRTIHGGVYDDSAALFVFTPNGKPDTSVGVGGMLDYAFPAAFFKVATSPDGKHVAATAQSVRATADAGSPLGSILVTLDVGN